MAEAAGTAETAGASETSEELAEEPIEKPIVTSQAQQVQAQPAHSQTQTHSQSQAQRRRGHHHRVVRQGTEWFEADGTVVDPEDRETSAARSRDDDERILTELPPHWGVYSERRQDGA